MAAFRWLGMEIADIHIREPRLLIVIQEIKTILCLHENLQQGECDCYMESNKPLSAAT